MQARVSTPALSIHGNCLESGRQGTEKDFSQYANSIPLIFKSVLKGYCFRHKKAQTGMRETVRAAWMKGKGGKPSNTINYSMIF